MNGWDCIFILLDVIVMSVVGVFAFYLVEKAQRLLRGRK